ncbi:ankyrin-3-like [Lolium rigidum]|uniref:ankyrin-3-like n=1 Tax=Lolium rigidum TaxID=89674 RepID=UPI001F5CEDF3|nr:ankyrin-3-like [Lolium rigidum]
MALQKSSVSCMKLLIQGSTNVSCDNPLDNPLVKAAEKGLTEAIKCLLEAGANPNVHDTFGRLPIELAAEYGTREDVEILFPFTSPISTVEKWSVDGIISHVKMEIKQLEILFICYDPNLLFFFYSGYSEIVEFLLSRGADVDAISVTGTPLSVASFKGHASTVKILLQHNADPNKGNRLFVALDMALRKSFVSCAKLLIQGGANVSSASPGDNPLVKAAEKGLTEAIKCLLEAGSNANVLDMYGRLPIELAAEYGTREDVEILFPFTSPISTVANWSVDGIISHVKMEIKQLEDGNFVKTRMSELKGQGDEAFKKQDYLKASVFYTQALKMDNFDAKLLSNRSLCFLRMGDGKRAYEDATECAEIRPKWAKAHYRLGAAFMCMKDYNSAYQSLSRALELNPESEEVEKLFWEAMEMRS